ncbi:hypothetical protein CXT91_03410 [Akkermansia muciniphila]|nr:hypothetical protein CXT91_03410 [Akkermansia muciniphila]
MKGTPPVGTGGKFLPGPSCNAPWRRMFMIPGNMGSPVPLLYGFPGKGKNSLSDTGKTAVSGKGRHSGKHASARSVFP